MPRTNTHQSLPVRPVRVWVKVKNPTLTAVLGGFASCRFEVRFVFVGDDQVHEAEGGRKRALVSAISAA